VARENKEERVLELLGLLLAAAMLLVGKVQKSHPCPLQVLVVSSAIIVLVENVMLMIIIIKSKFYRY
jgi:hypothetical protein